MHCRPTLALAALVAFLALPRAAVAQAPASPAPEPLLAPVRALVEAFNGSAAFPDRLFTDDAVVTDEFPPYLWSGRAGAKRWWTVLVGDPGTPRRSAFTAARERIELTGAPEFTSVGRASAWFIVPAALHYTAGGKERTQRGRWQFIFRRDGGAWKIAAHMWDELSDD